MHPIFTMPLFTFTKPFSSLRWYWICQDIFNQLLLAIESSKELSANRAMDSPTRNNKIEEALGGVPSGMTPNSTSVYIKICPIGGTTADAPQPATNTPLSAATQPSSYTYNCEVIFKRHRTTSLSQLVEHDRAVNSGAECSYHINACLGISKHSETVSATCAVRSWVLKSKLLL